MGDAPLSFAAIVANILCTVDRDLADAYSRPTSPLSRRDRAFGIVPWDLERTRTENGHPCIRL